jgi:small conductance mechanosensitive channel
MTKEYSRYVFDVGVAYREDVDEVIDVIKEVDENLRNDPQFKDDILEPIEILGLDQFADSAIIIKARTKTKPIRQWAVGREFNRRLKRRFDEKDIEIPFPHVTLYMGQDKDGQSAPLHVETKQN